MRGGAFGLVDILADWRARCIDAPGTCPQIKGEGRRAANVLSSLDAVAQYVQQNLGRWAAEQNKRRP